VAGARSEDTLAGIGPFLPEFIRLSKALDRDAGLRTRCEEVLASLPDPANRPLDGGREGRSGGGTFTLPPRHGEGGPPPRTNCEIRPSTGSSLRAQRDGHPRLRAARRTFERRILPAGPRVVEWTPSGPPGSGFARGCRLAAEHADLYNRFRYAAGRATTTGRSRGSPCPFPMREGSAPRPSGDPPPHNPPTD